MLTTHEKIRIEAGLQNLYSRVSFQNSPNNSLTTFYVDTDDRLKIAPNFSTGTTVAGVSDVAVWVGLSGVVGASRMVVSSIDADLGSVTLNTAPSTGASLVIDFASSELLPYQIEDVRLQAESIINQRLSICYDLPISPIPSVLTSMASRLGAALLLIRNYGGGARSTSKDGYALYEQLMGKQQFPYSDSGAGVLEVGEIGMICRPAYQLVDDNGNIIDRNDTDTVDSTDSYVEGGRVFGRLHNVTDENFRFKEPQVDADSNQAGSAWDGTVNQQG